MLKVPKSTLRIIAKWLMMTPEQREKAKAKRRKKRLKKLAEKRSIIKTFGKVRYYAAYWFGQWILFSWHSPIKQEPVAPAKKTEDHRIAKISMLLNDPAANRYEKDAAKAALRRITRKIAEDKA